MSNFQLVSHVFLVSETRSGPSFLGLSPIDDTPKNILSKSPDVFIGSS